MIKVKEIKKDSKESLEFPCLMESRNTGNIFYIINIKGNDASGILLVNKSTCFSDNGKFSISWYAPVLKPYNGTLEISNG